MKPPNTEPYRSVYRWLRANGVDEAIPDKPRIAIDERAGRFTMSRFRWLPGRDRWNPENLDVSTGAVLTERFTLLLMQPPGDKVIAMMRHAKLMDAPP